MARYKTPAKKARLAKKGTQTKWAPFWVVPKAAGVGKKIHPSRFTSVKRNWRKTKINA
ncbi:50S ribosomal protein L39e [Candidatus Woesearchaeota archaeon]|nr:50S ribosomal protein L39e [Candidatus Woesearchaeota archaeon]